MKIKATLFVLVVLLVAVVAFSYYQNKEAFEDLSPIVTSPVPGVKYNIYVNRFSQTPGPPRYLTTLPGNRVGTWSPVPTAPPQNWYFDEKGRLVSDDKGQYPNHCIKMTGTTLALAPCSENSTKFQYVNNQLQIVSTALCLNLAGGTYTDGAEVNAYPCAQARWDAAQGRSDTVSWFFVESPNNPPPAPAPPAPAPTPAATNLPGVPTPTSANLPGVPTPAAANLPGVPTPAPVPIPVPAPVPAPAANLPGVPTPAPVPKPIPAPVIPDSAPAAILPGVPTPAPVYPSTTGTTPQNNQVVPENTISPTGQDASSLQKQMDLFGAIQKVVRNELLAWRSTKPILPGETEHQVPQDSKDTAATAQGKEYEDSCYKGTEYRCPKNPDGSCPPVPDRSQYIKKDQIPCWGCSLDY